MSGRALRLMTDGLAPAQGCLSGVLASMRACLRSLEWMRRKCKGHGSRCLVGKAGAEGQVSSRQARAHGRNVRQRQSWWGTSHSNLQDFSQTLKGIVGSTHVVDLSHACHQDQTLHLI